MASSLDYFFDELQIKEYQKISEIISPWVNRLNTPIKNTSSKNESPESLLTDLEIGHLDEISEDDYGYFSRKAFVVILSRPSRDQVNKRLIQNLRNKPYINEHYFTLLKVIARQSSSALKNKNRSPLERATHLYILENLISELSPYGREKEEVQEILQMIVDAQIDIPDEVHRERYVRALQPQTVSPSSIARQILKRIK